MIVQSIQISEALHMVPLAEDKAAAAVSEPGARVWLDLQGFTSGELDRWLDELGIGAFAQRLCREARDRPGFYPLKREVFFVIPVLPDTNHAGEVSHLAFLCTENLLLTLHRHSVMNPQKRSTLDESEEWLPERSIAGLVSAAMIDQSQACLGRVADLRSAVFDMEQRMDRDPETVEAEELRSARTELLTLGAQVSDQIPCVQALNRIDKPFFRLADAREYMGCALANLQAADAALTWLDHRIGALRAGLEMHAQDKTNRRLGMLTILSAIFMPITLLAGIWGMNFEAMPELKYAFSYPLALLTMTLVGAGMYLYFRKGGWFG